MEKISVSEKLEKPQLDQVIPVRKTRRLLYWDQDLKITQELGNEQKLLCQVEWSELEVFEQNYSSLCIECSGEKLDDQKKMLTTA